LKFYLNFENIEIEEKLELNNFKIKEYDKIKSNQSKFDFSMNYFNLKIILKKEIITNCLIEILILKENFKKEKINLEEKNKILFEENKNLKEKEVENKNEIEKLNKENEKLNKKLKETEEMKFKN
jgi:uncharacterized protein YlxW (UPF0749 family)